MRALPTGIVLLAVLTQPHLRGQARVTVDQLRVLMAGEGHAGDRAMADKVDGLQLSERLTAATLQRIEEAQHPGPQTAEALRLLSDSSAFLDPPAAEIPQRAAPGIPEQQAMMNGAVHFVVDTLKRLPDFFAARTTNSFDDGPTVVTHSGWSPAGKMHNVGTFSQEITFRKGREIVGSLSTAAHSSGKDAVAPGLTSSGEFGPLLAIILRDTAHGTVSWSHWEQSAIGVVGVFHYQVPQVQSHYEVNFCCVKSYEDPGAYLPGGTPNAYHGRPGYHGELSMDPATGAVVRVTLETELKDSDPISHAGVVVQFGTVALEGDKSYICPVRTLAVSTVESVVDGDFGLRTIRRVNEVAFTGYHRFGASTRIVSAGSH
ncbi:MAG: hypothetical protein ACLGXA_12650 [Acidobacteriota bacterium]